MPWIMQMAGFALLLVGIAVALWLSIWILGFLFIVGIGAVIYTHVRQYLFEKGIINSTPGIPPEPPGTIVEGDFERIQSPSKTLK